MLEGCTPFPAELAERYRASGYWRGEPLSELLRGVGGAEPDRVAVVAGARRVTYASLDERADRLAAGLHGIGLRARDRVVVQLPNSPEFVAVLVALFRLGAIPVLALPAHRRGEIVYLVEESGAVAYVVPDSLGRVDSLAMAGEVRAATGLRHVLVSGSPGPFVGLDSVDADPLALPPPDPGEVAFFLLSGGTTGRPKLIPRTHDDYAYQMRATAAAMGLDRDGAYLAALPAAHNAALGCPGVLGTLLVGATVVMAGSPSPDEVFALIERERVTLTTLMPAFVSLWLDLADAFPADLSRLTIEVGGARLDPQLAVKVRPVLGARLTQWFGMAEGLLCFTRPGDDEEVYANTQGRPLCPDDELRIVDDDDRDVPPGRTGQLLCRGPYTLRGYYRAEEHNRRTFTADGYFRTGDLARITDDGNLVVEGRIKDVINRGGEKISADEIEGYLRGHPKVRSAALIPVPDRRLGEKSCAVIVPDAVAPTLAELRDHLARVGLAEFKLPDRMELVPALPVTAVGKVDKLALQARFGADRVSAIGEEPR